FALDGRQIGEEIRLPRGGGTLVARVRLRSSAAVDHLEIIGNGRVVAAIPLTGDRTQASAAVPVTVAGSGWYVLRAYADRAELPVLDGYPFSSTSPVYVTVGSEPVRSSEDADLFMRWVDRLGDAAEAYLGRKTPAGGGDVLRLRAEPPGVSGGLDATPCAGDPACRDRQDLETGRRSVASRDRGQDLRAVEERLPSRDDERAFIAGEHEGRSRRLMPKRRMP